MKATYSNLIITLTIALLCMHPAGACPSDEIKMPAVDPPELSIASGLAFTHTAQYNGEFSAAVDSAKQFCAKYKRQHPDVKSLAIVSDIDETIVDNREEYAAHPDKFVWSEFEAWLKQARAPALKKTAAFLKWARKEGFAIMLVTGRPEPDRIYTIENLVHDGIAYDALYMRPNGADVDSIPAQVFKTGARKSIADMGFTVVVNIGDQFSDLVGGHSIDCEKLPNKMYFIK